jgi:hypothetical protein
MYDMETISSRLTAYLRYMAMKLLTEDNLMPMLCGSLALNHR